MATLEVGYVMVQNKFKNFDKSYTVMCQTYLFAPILLCHMSE